jgi:thymidylate synthase ThyX
MKVIEPAVEIYREPDHFRKIETIARVCTGTQDKVGSNPDFLDKLLKLGHGTPFEHVRVKVDRLPDPCPEERLLAAILGNGKFDSYGMSYRIRGGTEKVLNPQTGRKRKEFFNTLNGRDYLAMGGKLEQLKDLPEDDCYLTVKFTIDIGIARELVRHRQMSFMERSTRYAKWDKDVEFVRPRPFEWAKNGYTKSVEQPLSIGDIYDNWIYACEESEKQYHWLLHDLDCSPQEARTCLNLSAATVLYVTGMDHQWADVLNLRLAKGAHPSMRYIMRKLIELPDFPAEILGMVDTEVLENAKSE